MQKYEQLDLFNESIGNNNKIVVRCEVEAICYKELGFAGATEYKCGWTKTTVAWCPRRRRLLNGGEP